MMNQQLPTKPKRRLWIWIVGGILMLLILNGAFEAPQEELSAESQEQTSGTSQPLKMPKGYLSRKDFGDAWPLKGIDSGVAQCYEGDKIIFVTPEGTYAINGKAQSVANDMDWKKVDEIHIVGKDISPILNAGFEKCEE